MNEHSSVVRRRSVLPAWLLCVVACGCDDSNTVASVFAEPPSSEASALSRSLPLTILEAERSQSVTVDESPPSSSCSLGAFFHVGAQDSTIPALVIYDSPCREGQWLEQEVRKMAPQWYAFAKPVPVSTEELVQVELLAEDHAELRSVHQPACSREIPGATGTVFAVFRSSGGFIQGELSRKDSCEFLDDVERFGGSPRLQDAAHYYRTAFGCRT
jgi:hypothetical protein